MIKLLISEYKKVSLYGDLHLEENGGYYPFRGKSIMVKLFGLFWITYSKVIYEIKE